MDSRAQAAHQPFEDVPFKPMQVARTQTLTHNKLQRRFKKAWPRALVTHLAIPFLSLPIVAWTVHNQPAEPFSRGYYLMKVTEVAPTVFPMVFAAILGMFLRATATRLAEKGCKLGTIEQLIGTSTTGSALILPFTLQAFNLLTLILILLFALSPLGSQASLRILAITNSTTVIPRTVYSLNPFFVSSHFAGSSSAQSTLQADSIYASTILAPNKIKYSPRDPWGNIKIPYLEYHTDQRTLNGDPVTNDADGWIPTNKRNTTYSSHLGWPVVGAASSIPGITLDTRLLNTNVTIETAYWHISCDSLSTVSPDPCYANPRNILLSLNGTAFAAQCFNATSDEGSDWYFPRRSSCTTQCLQIGYNKTTYNPLPRGQTNPTLNPLPLVVLSTSIDAQRAPSQSLENQTVLTVAQCHLHQSWVQVNITCDTSECHASGIRRIPADDPFHSTYNPRNISNILANSRAQLDNFLAYFQFALEDRQGTNTLNGNTLYILNPEQPFSNIYNRFGAVDANQQQTSLFQVGAREFGYRLSQLVNTYYQSSGSTWRNPERLSTIDPSLLADGDSGISRQTETRVYKEVYTVETLWAVITFVASMMLFFFGAVATVWGATGLSPEVFGVGMFSSLLVESRHVERDDSLHGAVDGDGVLRSVRDSDEKAVLLKNRRVRFGDVRGYGEVGYISFGMVEGEEDEERRTRRRGWRRDDQEMGTRGLEEDESIASGEGKKKRLRRAVVSLCGERAYA